MIHSAFLFCPHTFFGCAFFGIAFFPTTFFVLRLLLHSYHWSTSALCLIRCSICTHWTLPNKSQHEEPFPKFPQRPPYFGLSLSSSLWLLFSVLLCLPRKVTFNQLPALLPPRHVLASFLLFPPPVFVFLSTFLLSSSFQHTTFPADVHFFLLFLEDKRKTIPTRTILTIKDRLKKGKKRKNKKAEWKTVEMKRVDKFTILVFTSVIFDNLARVSSTWWTRAAVQPTSTIALIRKKFATRQQQRTKEGY